MSKLCLFGRGEQVSTLRKCFQRIASNDNGADGVKFDANFRTDSSKIIKELVYVLGHSGVGKSALTRTIVDDVDDLHNGLFVEGKFDLITSNEPYSGVAKAFSTICRKLLSLSVEETTTVGKIISNELKDEVQNLLPLIPELKDVIGVQMVSKKGMVDGRKDKWTLKNRQERWKYAFRILTRALNAIFPTIVIVFDDLQWADISSLQVIDFLMTDMQNPNRLMIIGCYRSEEVEEADVLSKSIERMKEREGRFGFNLTEIKLNSCKLEDVNKIIMKRVLIDNEMETLDLAKICYKRTLGNPFFVLQFLRMLEKDGLLYHDDCLDKWIWDIDKIKQRAHFMSDVVDLLQGRMSKMSDEVKLLLQYAACLGASFTLSTINIIWQEHGTDDTNKKSDLLCLLGRLQEEHFIEEYGENGYRWVHDKVQEAALSLSDIVNASFKFKIGKTLVSALDESELDEKLFDVVDLINHGNVRMRADLATLNLRAATKAQGLSAFQSAANYVEYGVSLLPRDHWESQRELSLGLFSLGTKVGLALGKTQAATHYLNPVLEQEHLTVMEKLPLQMALIEKLSMGDLDGKKEALDMCLSLLKDLEYPMVWSKGMIPLQTMHGFVSTVKATKKWLGKDGKNATLNDMIDPRHLAITRLLERVGWTSYYLELMFLSGLAICHQAKMTLKCGKNPLSGVSLVNMGFMSWSLLKEDFRTAMICVEAAMSIQDSLDPQYGSQAKFMSYILCFCWHRPLQWCISPLLDCYRSAMRVGDLMYATYSLCSAYVWIPYVMGRPLMEILKECPNLVSHMEELQQIEQVTIVKLYWQTILNLTNDTGIVEQLEGSVFDSSDYNSGATGPHSGNIHLLQGELLLLVDVKKAANRAIQDGNKYQKLLPGFFIGTIELFHRGVALYAMARQSGKRKYKVNARKIRKTVKQWIKDGNANIEHYDLLLDAEHAALSSRSYDKADKYYRLSVNSACKVEHLLHCALCCERYSDFLLHVCSDKTAGLNQLSEAIRYYKAWGAFGKANQLIKSYHTY